MNRLTLASLNVKLLSLIMFYDDWSTMPWDTRPRAELLAKYLISKRIDIVCLQEVWSENTRAYLDKTFKAAGYYTIPKSQGPWYRFYTEDSGLFFASLSPIISSKFWMYPDASGADSWSDKGLLQVLLGTKIGLLRVYNTHLNADPKGQAARTNQLKLVSACIETAGPKCPTVLAGDLNVPYGTDEYQAMCKILGGMDILEYLGSGNIPTFDPIDNYSMMAKADRGSTPVRLDYLFSFGAKVDAMIDRFKLPHGRHTYISDHFGIMADIFKP